MYLCHIRMTPSVRAELMTSRHEVPYGLHTLLVVDASPCSESQGDAVSTACHKRVERKGVFAQPQERN